MVFKVSDETDERFGPGKQPRVPRNDVVRYWERGMKFFKMYSFLACGVTTY